MAIFDSNWDALAASGGGLSWNPLLLSEVTGTSGMGEVVSVSEVGGLWSLTMEEDVGERARWEFANIGPAAAVLADAVWALFIRFTDLTHPAGDSITVQIRCCSVGGGYWVSSTQLQGGGWVSDWDFQGAPLLPRAGVTKIQASCMGTPSLGGPDGGCALGRVDAPGGPYYNGLVQDVGANPFLISLEIQPPGTNQSFSFRPEYALVTLNDLP